MNWLKNLWSNETVRSSAYALLKALVTAALATLGVASFTGCSSMSTTPRGQTTEIVAVGLPAVAWITHTAQTATHEGDDTVSAEQAPTNDVDTSLAK